MGIGPLIRHTLSPYLTIRSACRLKQCNRFLNQYVYDGVKFERLKNRNVWNTITTQEVEGDMRFVREMRIPRLIRGEEFLLDVFKVGVTNSRFDILEYFTYSQMCWLFVYDNAIFHNKVHVIKWLHYNRNISWRVNAKMAIEACKHVEIAQFLIDDMELSWHCAEHCYTYTENPIVKQILADYLNKVQMNPLFPTTPHSMEPWHKKIKF